MRFKCFVFSVLLIIGCVGSSNCGAKDSNDKESILQSVRDSLSCYGERFLSILGGQKNELTDRVDTLSKKIECFEEMENQRDQRDKISLAVCTSLVVITLVLAIISLLYARRVRAGNKRFIGDTSDRLDEIEKALKSLKPGTEGVSYADFQGFKVNVEKRFADLEKPKDGANELPSGETELPPPDIKTGYFMPPCNGDAGKVYFDDFSPTKEGSACFKVEVNGDNATFEPISLTEIKYDATVSAIEFSGGVTRAQAQGMDVKEKGMAVRQNDGRWLITSKTKIILK